MSKKNTHFFHQHNACLTKKQLSLGKARRKALDLQIYFYACPYCDYWHLTKEVYGNDKCFELNFADEEKRRRAKREHHKHLRKLIPLKKS